MNGIEGILNGDLQSHAQAFDTSASGAVSGFETSADNIESNADAVLDPIEAQLTTDIDNAEDTYEADEATDLLQFTTDQSTENLNLQTTLDGIDAWLDGQIQIADGTFDGDLATENGTFDAAELLAEGIFNTLVAAEDSTFETSRQTEETGFNFDESANWSAYETTVGDSTSGATGTYEATVSAYESSRDSQLAAYPNTTYDASVLDPTAVQGVIDAANSAYQSAVAPIMAAYESAVAGRETAYNSATTTAYSTYSSSLATAQQTRDSAYQTSDDTRNSAYAAANSAYNTAINGLGGVMDQFNGALQAANDQLATDSQTATAAYQSAMEPAADVRDAAIDQANHDFTDWFSGSGTASAVTSEWVKVTHTDNSTVPPTVTWEAGDVYSSANGDGFDLKKDTTIEPFAPPGYVLTMQTTVVVGAVTTLTQKYSGGGLPAGSRNVFSSAMEARTKEYQDRLDEIEDDYQDEIGPYAITRNNAVQAANDLYLTQLYGNTTGMTPFGVGTPAETFMNAQNGAMQSFSSAEFGDWQTFQDATTAFWTNWMSGFSSDPMNMPPPPDYSILEQLAKDYAVSVANGTITYAQAMASAVTAFMSSERAIDSTRDGSIASAEAQYQKDLVNANETASTKAVTAYDGYAKDMLGIDAAYTVAQAGREKTREAKITDAEQTYALTDNTESETQAKALNKAYRDYNKSVASAWETRTNSTAAADTTRTKAYADADEDHTNDYAGADGTYANDEAAADKTLTKDLGQAEVDREKGIAQDQTSVTSQLMTPVSTFVSSVANGIDALYTSYHAGDTDQAAVSGIMTQFSINAAAAWSTLTNAEAGAFQTYINDTMDDWKDEIDTLADDAETRINNLVPGFTTMISSLASAAKDFSKNMADAAEDWLKSASAASKSADHQAADAAKSSGDTIVGYAKTLADLSVGNWHTGINSVLDASLNFITNTTNTALPFMQQFVGAVTGLTNSLIGFAATESRNDIDSIKTALVNATTTDDSLFAAWATLMGKQSILFATQMRDSTDATPASTFTYGSRMTSPMMGYNSAAYQSDESIIAIREGLVTQYLITQLTQGGNTTTNSGANTQQLQLAAFQAPNNTNTNTNTMIGADGRLQQVISATPSMRFLINARSAVQQSKLNIVNPASKGFFVWQTAAGIWGLVDTVPVAIHAGGQEAMYKIVYRAGTTDSMLESGILYGVGVPLTGYAVLNSDITSFRAVGTVAMQAIPTSVVAWYRQGSAADAEWRTLTLSQKYYYELGQQTRSLELFRRFEALSPAARGEALVEYYGGGLAGHLRAICPQGSGFMLGAGETLHTGPTPIFRFLIENGATYGGGIGQMYYGNTQVRVRIQRTD